MDWRTPRRFWAGCGRDSKNWRCSFLRRPHPSGRFHSVQKRDAVRWSESILPIGRLNKQWANPPGLGALGVSDTIQELHGHSVMEELVADHQVGHRRWVHVLGLPSINAQNAANQDQTGV